MISRIFFSQKYQLKTCTSYMLIQRLLWHDVSAVNDYADTMIVWSTIMWTSSQHCQWLRGTVVHDYGKLFYLGKSTLMKNLTKTEIWYSLRWLCGHAIFELWDRISSQKQRSSQNHFFACSYEAHVESCK